MLQCFQIHFLIAQFCKQLNDKKDIIKVRNEHLKDFIDFVSKEGKKTADERISSGTIKIDDH